MPKYFIDSVNGNDSNSGTNQVEAWKTWAKLVSVLGATPNSQEIYIARGSELRESVELGNFNVLSTYGAGPRPIINGSDVATGWSKECPYNNVWCIKGWVITGGGPATFISVVENGRQLKRLGSVAEVEATHGSYFGPYDPPLGSTNEIYIHPRGSTNPNTDGNVYEIGRRNHALFFGNYNEISDIHTRNQMSNNGSVEGGFNNVARRVLAENGGKHNFFISSGVVEDCCARFQEYGGQSATLFVHYSEQSDLEIRYVRCTASDAPNASGFFGHSGGSGYRRAEFEDCRVEFCQSFGAPGTSITGAALFRRCSAFGLSLGGWSTYGGVTKFIECSFIQTPYSMSSPSLKYISVGGTGSTVLISGCAFSGAPYGISASASGAKIIVTDSIISGDGNAFTIWGVSGTLIDVNNSIMDFPYVYSLSGNNAIKSASNNVYPRFLSSLIEGVAYASWSAYRLALPGIDSGSLNANMQWIGDVKRGNYDYLPTSPAVSVMAGPGWRLPPIP